MEKYIKGNVLIIDDTYFEAKPVIDSMARKGISTIYWDGNYQTAPENPYKGVRLVFLDMQFSTATDERNIATNMFNLLMKSISMENGPYILCIWSKHDSENLDYFKSEIREEKKVPQPYIIFNMEKRGFFEEVQEENEVYYEIASALEENETLKEEILQILEVNNVTENEIKYEFKEEGLQEIINKLNDKFREQNALPTLLRWEKIVNDSTEDLLREITNFIESNEYWDNNIKNLIQRLALANIGQNLVETNEEFIKNAFLVLNKMLPDKLDQRVKNAEIDSEFNFINSKSIIEKIDDDEYSITKIGREYYLTKNDIEIQKFKDISKVKEEYREICTIMWEKFLDYSGQVNFKLLCEENVNGFDKPGGIFKDENNEILKELIEAINIREKGKIKDKDRIEIDKCELIRFDISSACDYAQNKLKRIRILHGVIIKKSEFSKIANSDDVYATPEVKINGEIVKVVFNFQFIANNSIDEVKNFQRIFSIRELMMIDIKDRFTKYISRVGIINL